MDVSRGNGSVDHRGGHATGAPANTDAERWTRIVYVLPRIRPWWTNTCAVVVSNLDSGKTRSELRAMFNRFGGLSSVTVRKVNGRGRSAAQRTTADLIFISKRSAARVVRRYDNAFLDGRRIQLKLFVVHPKLVETDRLAVRVDSIRGPLSPRSFSPSPPSMPPRRDAPGTCRRRPRSTADDERCMLFVSNLDARRTRADLRAMFNRFGGLSAVTVRKEYGGGGGGAGRSSPRSTAHLIFNGRASATRAMRRYDNVLLDGRRMKLRLFVPVHKSAVDLLTERFSRLAPFSPRQPPSSPSTGHGRSPEEKL